MVHDKGPVDLLSAPSVRTLRVEILQACELEDQLLELVAAILFPPGKL